MQYLAIVIGRPYPQSSTPPSCCRWFAWVRATIHQPEPSSSADMEISPYISPLIRYHIGPMVSCRRSSFHEMASQSDKNKNCSNPPSTRLGNPQPAGTTSIPRLRNDFSGSPSFQWVAGSHESLRVPVESQVLDIFLSLEVSDYCEVA